MFGSCRLKGWQRIADVTDADADTDDAETETETKLRLPEKKFSKQKFLSRIRAYKKMEPRQWRGSSKIFISIFFRIEFSFERPKVEFNVIKVLLYFLYQNSFSPGYSWSF